MMGLKAIRKRHSLVEIFCGGSFSSKPIFFLVTEVEVEMHFVVMFIHGVNDGGAVGPYIL